MPLFHKPDQPSSSIKRVQTVIITWAQGPQPPRIQAIKPFFPQIQEEPLRLLKLICPSRSAKIVLLFLAIIAWLLPFTWLIIKSSSPGQIDSEDIISIDCTDAFWSSNNGCGVDGIDCRPFNGTSFPFRCPGKCGTVRVLNPKTVGAQEINYQSFVIGGPLYRADSWICAAGIHAGIVSNVDGGCGTVSLVGEMDGYESKLQNGIDSIGFNSSFPSSFTVEAGQCGSKDLRWTILVHTVAFTMFISLFSTSSAALFPTIFTAIFFHVGLVSDPPISGRLRGLFSLILGRFLPAALYAVIVYMFFLRFNGKAQIEKTTFWLGGCWIGALTNYTFDWIPISRLTPQDLTQQPGAILALAVIVVLLCSIVAQQIWYFRLEGRLIRYLGIYALMAMTLLIMLLIPHMRVRIHHYILALLFIPGTSIQTRSSLLYQGILLGFFINGIARWGFDSILQTDTILRGDGHFNSILPNVTQPVISLASPASISFDWAFPPPLQSIAEDIDGEIDGISILVNDVERYRRHTDEVDGGDTFIWTRDVQEPQYFRFGFMRGRQTFDYTKAGTWDRDGNWIVMKPGPGVRSRNIDEKLLRR